MGKEEFNRWAESHAAMFGLHSDTDAMMFDAWFSAFNAAGFTAEELHEATQWIATNNPPKYRTEHLDAIRRRIGQRRRDQAVANQESAAKEGFHCNVCSSGWVQVIRPQCVADGRLMPDAVWGCKPLVSVTCSCRHGERIFESLLNPKHGQPIKAIRLEDYEMRVPHWRELLAEYKASKQAEAHALRASQEADRENMSPMFAGILNRLRERER